MGEIKARHEVMKEEEEKNHSEQLRGLKQQYETSLEGNLVLPMDGWFFVHFIWTWVEKSMNGWLPDRPIQFYTCRYISDVIIFLTSSELSKSYKHQLQDLEKDMKQTEATLSVSPALAHSQESEGTSHERILNLPCGENLAGADRRAEWTEPSPAGEAKRRGEQEEVGWKKSGTLLSFYRQNCISAAFAT